MALNTELLITLQMLPNIGNKTILKFAQSVNTNSIEDLSECIRAIKKGRFADIDNETLSQANRTAHKIMETCERENIGIISYFESLFPQKLRECVDEKGTLDPPIVLYYRGNIKALEKPGIAVIGTREPTENGFKAGLFFSGEFAKRGYNIVSGLAIGCDTSGHQGALNVGGTTTAFLANSLDWKSIYPKENQDLARRIVDNGGLLLSEYYVGQKCGRYAFIARDRLQAGLSYATIAVQTDVNGGTMHAVNATIASHKPLFMVKYNKSVDLCNRKTQGNIKMINEGKALPINTELLEKSINLVYSKIVNRKTSTSMNIFSEKEIDTLSSTKKMKKVIFDLDLTLVDTTCLESARHDRNWKLAYSMIPQTKMYDGIAEVLDFIRKNNVKVAIVSTTPRPYIERIVSYYNIPAQYIVGYHDAKPIKPHPASMQRALELLGCNAKEAISFGDRVIDIQASNAAGIESVACCWGTKEKELLLDSKYDHLLMSPSDILNLLY